jgi:response regulator RpfG family c-di-GMP phosphodiesterase
MPPIKLAEVLCVDDEPRVLDGLRLTLRRGYDVSIATSGVMALTLLEQRPGIAVVISDMRMPVMDGAAFLTKVRERAPNAIRILLTGEPGRESAVAAVNEGQVFRFLTKPCAPDKLVAAVEAAVRQNQLVMAEQLLLRETVLGCIRALVDILAIVNPAAFGRGSRLKRMTIELAAAAGMEASWELEAAALLSQIGHVSLPTDLADKAFGGGKISAEEAQLLSEVPTVAATLLARIPRLENVATIIAHATRPRTDEHAAESKIAASAAVLRNVLDFDALVSNGESVETAIATLRVRAGPKQAELVTHLASLQGVVDVGPLLREILLCDVIPGMILLDDLRTESGTLLVSHGYEISQSFMDRMRNFAPSLRYAQVRVRVERPDVAL